MALEVHEDAVPFLHDGAERRGQLVAALAVFGSEDISGQTLRMHAGKRSFSLDIAEYQHHLFLAAIAVQVADRDEIAVHGGQLDIHHSFDT
jgi:hypothetical protein